MEKTIKSRSEMNPEYMWDLSVVFKDDDAWYQTLDEVKEKIKEYEKYRDHFMDSATSLYELLKLLLKLVSQESGVVAKVIASEEELKRFSTHNDSTLPIFKGWRKELFGKQALELKNGQLSISYDCLKHAIKISHLDTTQD